MDAVQVRSLAQASGLAPTRIRAGIAQLAEHHPCKVAVSVRSALPAWGTEPRPNRVAVETERSFTLAPRGFNSRTRSVGFPATHQ